MTPAQPFVRRLCALATVLTMAAFAGCASLPAGQVAATPAATPPPVDLSTAPAVAPPEVQAQAEPAAPPPSLSVPVRSLTDPTPDPARTDLWARVRSAFSLPDMDNERVRKWEQWYSSRPDYVQRMTDRGGRYLFHIVEEVQRRGMPVELALLPFIESAFNPQAKSSARAVGMWQFTPGTGRDFDLTQNVFRDDRRDVLASTRAALDYLQQLHDQLGDWQLALAAYNWGQGNVQRALAYNRRHGLPTDYESLRMPEETRDYYPKLQAVKNIIEHPDQFAIALPPLPNHPFFQSVAIERDIDVALAARLAGMPLHDFQQLNPQMNKPVILAAGTPQILLPYDNANRFLRELARHKGPLATWTAWVAPKTLKPADAARRVGMSETELREVNLIPARMLVKVGSTLLVPRSAHDSEDVDAHVADNATMVLAPDRPPLRRVALRAGKHGDSVVAVARRYHVATAQVAEWNRVAPHARFRPGQTIFVMLPPSPRHLAVRRSAHPTKIVAKRHAVPVRRVAKRHAAPHVRVAAHRPAERVAER